MQLFKFSQTPHSVKGEYTLLKTLDGHVGNINCIEGKGSDGRPTKGKKGNLLLASGGDHGICIWNAESGIRVQDPGYSWERGKVSAMAWILRLDEDDMLVWGTGNGVVACWAQKGQDHEAKFVETWNSAIPCPTHVETGLYGVSGIAYDATSFHIAASTLWGGIWLYKIVGNAMEKVWSVSTESLVMSVSFGEFKNGRRNLLAFGERDGIFEIDVNSTKKALVKDIGGRIVHAKIDDAHTFCCISDPSLGAILYRMDGWTRQKSFPVPVTKTLCMKQVALVSDETEVAIGSDHGKVYIWDRKKGGITDVLWVSEETKMAQIVAATKMKGSPVIVTGRSQKIDGNPIFIWIKRSDKGVIDYAREVRGTFRNMLQYALWFGAIVCVLQNFVWPQDTYEELEGLEDVNSSRGIVVSVLGLIYRIFFTLVWTVPRMVYRRIVYSMTPETEMW